MPVALFTHEKIGKNKELMIGLTTIKWLLGSEDSPLGISTMTHRVLSTKKYIYYFSNFGEKKTNSEKSNSRNWEFIWFTGWRCSLSGAGMAAGVRQRPRRVHSQDVERDEGCCPGHFLSLIPSVPQPMGWCCPQWRWSLHQSSLEKSLLLATVRLSRSTLSIIGT